MRGLTTTRIVLYTLLFIFSTILIGLTASRIHHTKHLRFGDILTNRTHFYDPKIVALLVVSILALLFSAIILGTIAADLSVLLVEHICLWGLWIFFLVTAALVTHRWSNLKWCRHFNVCRVLEAIKAFSWICWGWLTFLLVATLVQLITERRGNGGAAAAPTPYQTRETTGTRTTTAPQAGYTASQGAPTPQTPKRESAPPGTGTGAGAGAGAAALYAPGTGTIQPVQPEYTQPPPRQIV